MILRKPYAILIKNFKLIHGILTALMGYILFKTFNIMSIFNEYFVSGKALIGENISASVFNTFVFVAPIIIIVLSLVLLVVMLVKKKPFTLYIAIIGIYVASLVILIMGKNTLLDMEVNILDIRVIKLVRDFTTMIFIAQIYPFIKSFVRTIGFDIKKFDFGKDLADLQVTENDNEEFEVNVSINTNKMKRGYNFRKRNLKYIYKENKVLIWLAIILFIFIVGIVIALSIFLNSIKYTSMNESFNVSGFNFKITDAYITRKNYKGDILTDLNDEMSMLVIPFTVKNNNTQDKGFLTAHIELEIGNHIFRNNTLYRDQLFDLGSVYDGEIINSKNIEYKTFMFEIPTNYLKDNMYLKITTSITIKGKDLIPSYITIPIKAVDLDKTMGVIEINPNEETKLSSNNLGNSTINISDIELSRRFRIDYNYKIGNEVIPSYEYLYAPLTTNVNMSLLKITNTYNLDETISLNSLYDLINTYGYINYTNNGVSKILRTINKVNPTHTKNNELYLSIPTDMETADNISLILDIRNYQYVYKIK